MQTLNFLLLETGSSLKYNYLNPPNNNYTFFVLHKEILNEFRKQQSKRLCCQQMFVLGSIVVKMIFVILSLAGLRKILWRIFQAF